MTYVKTPTAGADVLLRVNFFPLMVRSWWISLLQASACKRTAFVELYISICVHRVHSIPYDVITAR